MIEIEGVKLESVLYFKTASVRLNKNKLTFVRGLNFDGDPANPTGNGAGKSLLFSTIPTLFYFAPPLSLKRKSSKEILRKGSSVTIGLKTDNGHRYKITQTATSYTILENGVDLELRTKPLAEKFIRTLFPLSEIEYYTHGFVSTQKPFLMQTDSNINRLEHLSTIFRLESYDDLKQYFATKLRSIKDDEIKLSVLEQSRITLIGKIAKVSTRLDEKAKVLADSKHALLSSRLEALIEDEFKMLQTSQALTTLLTTETELDTLRSKYFFKDHPSKRLPWLKKQRTLAKEFESYNALCLSYKRNVASTQAKIDRLVLPSLNKDECLKLERRSSLSIEKRRALLSDMEDLERRYKTLLSKASPLRTRLIEYGVDPKMHKVDLNVDYSEALAAAKTSLKLQSLLSHADVEHGKDHVACPTCMSEVDLANIKTVVKKAKRDLPRLTEEITKQELYRELLKLRTSVAELKFNLKDMHDLRSSEASLATALSEATESLNTWKKYDYLVKSLDSIDVPVKPSRVLETELTYEQLDEQADLCNDILKHLEAKAALVENNPALEACRTVQSVRTALKAIGSTLKEAHESMADIRTELSDVSAFLEKQMNFKSELSLYTAELEDVSKKIAALTPAIDDKKILDTLMRAYSSKGLKTIVANRICSLLESNLNHYRGLIFSEPFAFTVETTDSGMSINVDRGNGMVSDVRNLSGAESNCFRLLFILSLLPLIPNERRLNMLVLDEPTAQCDLVTRTRMYDYYLPALMEVIPNIYVIDNQGDPSPKGAGEWLVAKKDGVSSLITVPRLY